ncbi:hypothetical protein [Kribbella sp. NPDC048928]|uniref:phosphotransferase-like protein n=1 Tax=Kribbella sp. NPDC048928 TaxID=3364111 RepID=UPI003715713B
MPAARAPASGMRAAVLALLDNDNNLILDEMPVDETIMPAWRKALAPYDVRWIALDAPLEVIEQRESTRHHGRHLGNARGHHGYGLEGPFDLTLNTATQTPTQRATTIAAL